MRVLPAREHRRAGCFLDRFFPCATETSLVRYTETEGQYLAFIYY